MEEVLNLACQLGSAIQSSESYIDYKLAEQKVQCDEELQKIISEFNSKKIEINMEISKEASDSAKMDELNRQISELYEKMMSSENMTAYNLSKQNFEGGIRKINTVIMASAAGQDPYSINFDELDSCGGGCASCSGCG